ncbi:MAG: penicillin-binding protein activator [Fibrobacter sp.]|jgi:ABC-type branched-subunit amino acid transport system substrate-binding protein|uniref:penicillin-binding protein activator n=1 Tax=Fibrobacter sp. UWP2 TaxID=1896216 RepID=UPI000921188A|nr:penicillin-binding protein activator [Fibrobacter sp. UWP2]MCR5378644.1 penicillin-binding protein activator [Fibrobacter sp.]SHI89670.1 ABC-type branched-chain amino acid transport system, substrate-binding protein [Fibrobacter sp. UWP2]
MKRLLPLLVATLLSTPLFAQDEVAQAKALIRDGKCADAIAPLQKLSKAKFKTHAGAQASVMLTECYLREHKRDEALSLSSKFLEYHVSSEYRERMELAHAILLVEKGSVYEGVEAMLRILAYTKNPAARSRTKEVAVQTLAASLMTADQLQALLEKYPVDKDVVGWMQLQVGRESQNARRYKAARYWYKKVLKGGVAENLSKTAEKGLESLEDQGAGMPTVLVLAPLSGDFAEFGAAAIQGVLLAQEQAGLTKKVNVRIADTRADAAQALMRTQQAINQDSIIAVIGPIMSAPAATVAAWLGSNFQNIPMLTPTATDDGIAKMGPNIFQVNITMDNLAQSIADFATKCLNIREFAIMSPLGDYGSSMTTSFTRAVERRGGNIVAFRNYEEGRPDYKTEFDLLRDVRFKQENRRRNIARGASDLDAVSPKERRFYMSDSTFNIPGIFIPATNPGDAGAMVSQVAFNKISGVMLGASGWYGRELLIRGKRLVDSSFFSVPALDMNGNAEAFDKFSKAFQERWGAEPGEDKVSGLSYDAANIVFTTLAKKPESLTNALNNADEFKGVYGDIKFKRGANVNTKIVTVQKGKFETMDGCKIPSVEAKSKEGDSKK